MALHSSTSRLDVSTFCEVCVLTFGGSGDNNGSGRAQNIDVGYGFKNVSG